MNWITKKKLIPIIFLTTLLSSVADTRTFTDTQGRKIEASVIEILDNSVKLQIKGKTNLHTIPFSKLSSSDVAYLTSLEERKTDPTRPREEDKKIQRKKSQRGMWTSDLMAEYGLKDNFNSDWPGIVSVSVSTEVDIISEDKDKGSFVYYSPNYEFICDVKLSKNVIQKFSVMFEATREYCRLLPVSTMKAHVPGKQFRNKILLFESYQSYIKNGGLPQSAGVYRSREGTILIPLTSLGVKKVGSSYMYDYGKSNKTLIHEIVHQLTDPEYYSSGARGWFSEGFAEYCANTPYRSGKFLVKTNASSIKDYATGFNKYGRGRNIGKKFIAPNLQDYMLLPYQQFTANGNFNYAFGMLLTYYFFHMEEDTSNITNFLKALKEGKQDEEALQILLNGRSFDQLEQDVRKAWKSKGVKIEFN